MKKAGIGCILLVLLMMTVTARAQAAVHGSAQAAVVLEVSTGRVLYAYNADAVLPMASTTKIMTALCVLEHAGMDEIVEIQKGMTGAEGSSIYLEAGEELTVEQLLYGLMLRSGNDAAEALAIHTAGSVDGFVEWMNQKSEKLGLSQTHFVNPHGLPAQGHASTAYEMAKITAAAYEWEEFRNIVATQYKTVPWKGHPYDRAMKNKNKMLTLYPGANGVKTGYTKAAGRCLVSAAQRSGMQLICVVLNAPDMWNDSVSLLDYGFENYRMTQVLSSLEPAAELQCTFCAQRVPVLPLWDVEIPLGAQEKYTIALDLPEKIEAGVARGQQMGYAIIGAEGAEILRVPLVAGKDVQLTAWMKWKQAAKCVLTNWFGSIKKEQEA